MTQPKTKGGVPPIEIHTIPKPKTPSTPKPKQTDLNIRGVKCTDWEKINEKMGCKKRGFNG